jgi:hypothetical protein
LPRKQKNQHKKQQRALQKRTKRKQKLARKQTTQAAVGINPRRLLRMARQMPVEGAWVQQGWQEQGVARVLIARIQPNDSIMFGEYIVDYFCTGIKDASYASNVKRETFSNEVIPRLYSGTPPLDIEASLAHEVVWGAVEYAESLGFDPHRNFREASRILDPAGTMPRSGSIDFGYQGIPLYIPAPDDNQVGIIRRLIEAVGLGNFYYLPRGDVPEEVAELLRVEQPEETPDSAIWTPELQQRSGADTQSGLWVPGQQPEPASEGEQSEQSLIWTPGRS